MFSMRVDFLLRNFPDYIPSSPTRTLVHFQLWPRRVSLKYRISNRISRCINQRENRWLWLFQFDCMIYLQTSTQYPPQFHVNQRHHKTIFLDLNQINSNSRFSNSSPKRQVFRTPLFEFVLCTRRAITLLAPCVLILNLSSSSSSSSSSWIVHCVQADKTTSFQNNTDAIPVNGISPQNFIKSAGLPLCDRILKLKTRCRLESLRERTLRNFIPCWQRGGKWSRVTRTYPPRSASS